MSDKDVVTKPTAAITKPIGFEPRSPVIAVDLDNVCFWHGRGLRPYAVEWIGRNDVTRSGITLADLTPEPGWFAPEWGVTPKQFMAIEEFAIRHGFFAQAQPIDGAATTLAALADSGYTVRYVTARPRVHDAAEQTYRALASNGFPEGPVLFVGGHFGSAAKSMVHASVFIDDSVSNIADFRRNGVPYIVYDQVYNRELGDQFRARNWSDVPALIEQLVRPLAPIPDRSYELYAVEQQCARHRHELERLFAAIAQIDRDLLLRGTSGKQRAAREHEQHRSEFLQREVQRVSGQLERAEHRRAELEHLVEHRHAFVMRHPEYAESPDERKVGKAAHQLRIEQAELEVERQRIVDLRNQLDDERQRITAMSDDLAASITAVDSERRALGLSERGVLPAADVDEVPTMYVAYGPHVMDNPAIAIALGSHVAQPCAEFEIARMGYTIIGRRINASCQNEHTDLDILGMRTGLEGDLLQRERNEILDQFDRTANDDLTRRDSLLRQLRDVEHRLFVAVEVKWGGSSLSRSQQKVYRTLHARQAIRITGELPDRGESSGVRQGTSITARPLVIRVGMKEWVGMREAEAVRAARQRSQALSEGAIEHDAATAPDVAVLGREIGPAPDPQPPVAGF